MYAVIKTGSKQYGVTEGTVLHVEKLHAEAGEEVSFDEVLLVANGATTHIGQPVVSGAKVTAKVLGEKKGKKLIVFKKRRRHGAHQKKGHRQAYTELRVTDITAGN